MKRIVRLGGLMIIILLSSCTSQKNLVYFQNDNLKDTPDEQRIEYNNEQNTNSPIYRLCAHDMLYIQITSSLDEETTKLFSGVNIQNSSYSQGTETGIYLNSYEVNEEGNITLPVLGAVNVLDLTIDQAKAKIQTLAEEYSKGIVVNCRMVTFKIKVLGEVNRPGIYTFYQPSVDIFDVLAQAGDLTYDGNRSKIRIVRKTADADLVYTLDIRKSSVVKDPRYYLRPGDIVYVEPNKNTKKLTTINRPLTTITSTISLIASTVAIIVSINNLSK